MLDFIVDVIFVHEYGQYFVMIFYGMEFETLSYIVIRDMNISLRGLWLHSMTQGYLS